MNGEDAEKLALQHTLASSDFLAAEWQKVPERFLEE
jgi:hypothetical protein